MTFQEILEGITRHRSHRATVTDPEIQRKFEEIEWALQSLAEALRDREQNVPDGIQGKVRRDELDELTHGVDYTVGDPVDDVDDAFDEFEKRK